LDVLKSTGAESCSSQPAGNSRWLFHAILCWAAITSGKTWPPKLTAHADLLLYARGAIC